MYVGGGHCSGETETDKVKERMKEQVSLESFLYSPLAFPNPISRWTVDVICQRKRFLGHSNSIYLEIKEILIV